MINHDRPSVRNVAVFPRRLETVDGLKSLIDVGSSSASRHKDVQVVERVWWAESKDSAEHPRFRGHSGQGGLQGELFNENASATSAVAGWNNFRIQCGVRYLECSSF